MLSPLNSEATEIGELKQTMWSSSRDVRLQVHAEGHMTSFIVFLCFSVLKAYPHPHPHVPVHSYTSALYMHICSSKYYKTKTCLILALWIIRISIFWCPIFIFFGWCSIRIITKLSNSEQSSKGKVKTHKYINRQNQSTSGILWKS
jgi:hypothetical protein